MRFKVQMKTPDALHYAIKGLARDEDQAEQLHDHCQKWFKYGELLTVEIDTVEGTCTVVHQQ